MSLRESIARWWQAYLNRYFSSKGAEAGINGVLYLIVAAAVAVFGFVNIFAELIVRDCNSQPDPYTSGWDNKLYPSAPCYYQPRWELLGLSLWEADKGQRLMLSIICGSALGYERRSPDRPAGIKLMSLVSLGACCFTISSMFCFESSSSSFDTARVSAAIVSGVGFLGSAMIWKSSSAGADHDVHGLTTAASVWVAASLGIASGGHLYFLAVYTTVAVTLMLRFGPRSPEKNEDDPESGPTISLEAGPVGIDAVPKQSSLPDATIPSASSEPLRRKGSGDSSALFAEKPRKPSFRF